MNIEVRAGLANGLKPNFRSTGKMPVGLTNWMPVLRGLGWQHALAIFAKS
jgi:hypothetical protein